MTTRIMRAPEAVAQGRTYAASEPVAVRIEERREELAQHNPGAVRLAGAVLAAMRDRANGHTPDIRVDRQIRHRQLQFDGSKALPVEDLAAIAMENDLGRDVIIAGLSVLAEAIGQTLTPIGASAVPLRAAASRVLAQMGATTARAAAALEDNEITEHEAAQIDRDMEEVEARVALWKAARAAEKGVAR